MFTPRDKLPSLRLRALRQLKRCYLLNRQLGMASEQAIDCALTRVKEIYLGLHGEPGILLMDHELTPDDRHWLWNEILEVLIEVQIILPNAYEH